MVYACPAESDPRDKLEDYVKDPEYKTIAGLRTEGLQGLIFVDREILSDNGIDFPKDLARYMEKEMASGKRCNFLMCDDLPVINWQSALQGMQGKDVQVYCFSVACRQIPSCAKML